MTDEFQQEFSQKLLRKFQNDFVKKNAKKS